MSLATTELELTDVNTISIPTDAIFILSLLIIFGLLGYFFHKIFNTHTNKFNEKVKDNLNIKLSKEKLTDQLIIVSSTVNQESVEKPRINKLKNLTPLKVLGMSSMAVATIGGASLLGIQAMQNSYQALNTSQKNIKTKNLSAKTFISIPKLKSLDKSKTKIKYVNYDDPLLSVNNNSKKERFYQFKASETDDFFSF
ncbi:hypothetical protein [Prochlorococcus marinus]|uniref:hypothetical protein n=1 Tax=Prochlorococcus marinus TaxID=1219 RepID=UPI0022B4268E|nr:hypothetical protein [Prochlorococcus marinus]